MKRSKRIETLDARPVNLDGYINEWPEMGFAAMSSPYDPEPSVRVEDGRIVELDGKYREDFDFIDQFIADVHQAGFADHGPAILLHRIINRIVRRVKFYFLDLPGIQGGEKVAVAGFHHASLHQARDDEDVQQKNDDQCRQRIGGQHFLRFFVVLIRSHWVSSKKM